MVRRRNVRRAPFVLLTGLFLALVFGGSRSAADQLSVLAAISPPSAANCSSSSWYLVCFTIPFYPDDKTRHKNGLDSALAGLIDRAVVSVDLAAYDFDLPSIADALIGAQSRGLSVRVVMDSDTLNSSYEATKTAIDKLKAASILMVGDNRSDLMHSKFVIVDKRWIQTGSWNYTDSDTYRLNNNAIFVDSPALADRFTAEFDKMFVKLQFGPKKTASAPAPPVTIDGASIESLFAPKDGVANRIIAKIEAAKKSVRFLTYSFTHDGIGDAVLDRYRAGLIVRGVFDTTGAGSAFSEYGTMKAAGVPVFTDGNPYFMHHKVFILDEETIVTGSFNFSAAADTSNDEDLLIVTDAGLAAAYRAEFDRVFRLASERRLFISPVLIRR